MSNDGEKEEKNTGTKLHEKIPANIPVDSYSAYWDNYYKFNDPTKVEYDPLIEKHPLPAIENLIFQGGGTKVTGLIGVLEYFRENREAFAKVKRVGGDSGGAMASLFFALNYSAAEMEKSLNFGQFKDIGEDKWWDPLRIFQAIEASINLVSDKFGLCKGDACYDWAAELVAKKLGNPNATFKDLHEKVLADPAFKDMYITGTCVDDENPLKYFNHEVTPNMPIALAVRISMSFPGAFKAVDMDGKKYVDGGVVDNNPMRMLDNTKYMQDIYREKFGLNATGANPCTLGFGPKNKNPEPNNSFIGMIMNAISSLYPVKIVGAILADNKKVQDNYYATTVYYDAAELGTLQEHVSDEQRKKAITSGYEDTKEHMRLYHDKNSYYDIKVYKSLKEKYENLKVKEIKYIQKNLQNFIENSQGISVENLKKIKDEFEYTKKVLGEPLIAGAPSKQELHAHNMKAYGSTKSIDVTKTSVQKEKAKSPSENIARLMQNYCKTINHKHKTEKLCNEVANKLQQQGDFSNANIIQQDVKQMPKLQEKHSQILATLEQKLTQQQVSSGHKLSKEELFDKICKLDKILQDYIYEYNVVSVRVLNFLTALLPNSVLPNKLSYVREALALKDEIRAIRIEMQNTEKWNILDVDKLLDDHKVVAEMLSKVNSYVGGKISDKEYPSIFIRPKPSPNHKT